jgi:hypothetical protein
MTKVSASKASPVAVSASSSGEQEIATFAGYALASVRSRQKSKKKDKNKPKRPLSAYNYFFKDEREKIVKILHGTELSKDIDDKDLAKLRTPEGNVSFAEMGRLIGQRWKTIDPESLVKYTKMATEDGERYKKAMIEYHTLQDKRMGESLDLPPKVTSFATSSGGRGSTGGMALNDSVYSRSLSAFHPLAQYPFTMTDLSLYMPPNATFASHYPTFQRGDLQSTGGPQGPLLQPRYDESLAALQAMRMLAGSSGLG